MNLPSVEWIAGINGSANERYLENLIVMDEIVIVGGSRDANPTLFGHPPPDWVVAQVFVKKTLSTAILSDKRRFTEIKG